VDRARYLTHEAAKNYQIGESYRRISQEYLIVGRILAYSGPSPVVYDLIAVFAGLSQPGDRKWYYPLVNKHSY